MFHKVACFHFDGIANHSDVIYVCFELEMSLGRDIGGGPTLLEAAKPYGEFIYCIPFLSVQQIGSRITLLWGCSMLLFWLPNILLLQRWNKIDIKTLHIAFASSAAALSSCTSEPRHTWCHYRPSRFSSPDEDYFDLILTILTNLSLYLSFFFFIWKGGNMTHSLIHWFPVPSTRPCHNRTERKWCKKIH